VVRYWDLQAQTLIASTAPDPTAVSQICFEPETGRHLFSASNRSLKAWDIENAALTDNVETDWTGVVDLAVTQSEAALIGLSITNEAFSVWKTDLSAISFVEQANWGVASFIP
jgi:hypothetical protein